MHQPVDLKKLKAFIAIGSMFATVEEFLTVVVLNRNPIAYLITLFALFPAFLTFVFFSSRLIDRRFRSEPTRELAHIFVYGFVGLMFEWFVMGFTPWSNTKAPAIVMLGFQIGMFCFWSSVAFAPRLLLGESTLQRKVARQILWFYVPYFTIGYPIALTVPAHLRFVTIVPLVCVGYFILNLFFMKYLVQSHASKRAELVLDTRL